MYELTNSQNLLVDAVNQAVEENPSCTDSYESLIEATYKKFLNNKLDDFPRMCQVAMVQNKIKWDEISRTGNSSLFEGSDDYQFQFAIPKDLYFFMVNLVYKNFWDNDNERVWRAFMNAVCRGDDAMTTLIKVKQLYGSNRDTSLTE